MSDQEWALAELEKRFSQMIRVGRIAELNEDDSTVTVQLTDPEDGSEALVTDELHWITTRAGEDREWWAPEPGEQVIVFAPGGDPAQGFVLPGIYQDDHPAPASKKTQHRREYKDGAFVQYDREKHEYEVNATDSGKIKLVVGQSSIEISATGIKISTPGTVEINGLSVSTTATATITNSATAISNTATATITDTVAPSTRVVTPASVITTSPLIQDIQL